MASPLTEHDWLDHTAEVTMRVRAPSFQGLLAEAARAFAELVPDHLGGVEEPGWRDFVLEAADPSAQLVDWLNELVFLAEVERWVPTRIEAEGRPPSAGDGPIRLRARGRRLHRPFVLVKAATLHGAELRRTNNGRIEAEVTLDV